MILVTGASGALGNRIVQRLDDIASVPVVAASRTPADGGRRVDFDDPTTLLAAFAEVDVLVFVSAGFAEDDVVLARHGAAIDAAARAGVRHVIYTSLSGTSDHLTIALAHRWTEARLAAATFSTTVLRNGIYAEVPAELAIGSAATAAATGALYAPLGDGRLSIVARDDLADVAARIAVEAHADLDAGGAGRHAGRTYELGGLVAVGGEEIAQALSVALGSPVRYERAPLGAVRQALTDAGLEPFQVTHTVSMLATTGAGMLKPGPTDLPALLTSSPRDALAAFASAVAAGVT
jgi:NAD(P)H dehydrogenase (quinone)